MKRGEYKKQLVRIKWVFSEALKREGKEDDVNLILLIQMLDFVVESFLKLVINTFPPPQDYAGPQAGYYRKISELKKTPYSPKLSFQRAWDEVVGIIRDPQNNISGNDLSLRREMDRLHEIRNDIQHKLAIPHAKEPAKYVTLVETFLANSYQDIFGEDFRSVSHLDLINNADIKEHLGTAHAHLKNGKWDEAVKEAAIALYIAFESVIKFANISGLKVESRINFELDTAFDPRLTRGGSEEGMTLADAQVIKRVFRGVLEEIGDVWGQIAAIGCGIDYVKYLKYKNLMPEIYRKLGDRFDSLQKRGYTEEDAKEIITYVETQVLAIQTSGVSGETEN